VVRGTPDPYVVSRIDVLDVDAARSDLHECLEIDWLGTQTLLVNSNLDVFS